MGTDLPEELVIDILYKLPVKEICKLKCVSKGWLNLLSDPEFKKNHSDRSKKKPNLLVLRQENNKLNVSWCSSRGNDQDAFTLLVDKDKYVGWPLKKPSRCGLICLWDSNVKFHVLNPSTHELKILPTPYYEEYCPVNHAGFGLIADSDEYVLVYITKYGSYGYGEMDCRILKFSDGNAESCSWESVDFNCPFRPWSNREQGVLVGNKFFWIADEYSCYNHYKMLDFDLESNEFNTIPLPDGFYHPSQRYMNWQWVELKEELCLVDTPSDLSSLELWILKDYTNHIWAKDYSIHYPVSGYLLTPFYFWDQKVLFNVWEKRTCFANQSIQCYDAKTTSFKTITNLTSRTFPVVFTQSFFSLGTRSNKADGGDERTTLKKNLVNASEGAATETNEEG